MFFGTGRFSITNQYKQYIYIIDYFYSVSVFQTLWLTSYNVLITIIQGYQNFEKPNRFKFFE